MKLNNRGWGYRMMALLMGILIFFLIVAIYYIYNYYDDIKRALVNDVTPIVEVI